MLVNLGPSTASGAESRQGDWRLETGELETGALGDEHRAPRAKRRRGSAIDQWRGPPVSANANANANEDWLGEPVDMEPSAAVTVHPGLLKPQRSKVKGRSKEQGGMGTLDEQWKAGPGPGRVDGGNAGDAGSVI